MGNKKYKKYFRKSYLSSGINGDVLLEDILKYNINKIIEIGVFQGVTARNICELLSASKKDFMYIGIDIFDPNYDNNDEILPIFKSSNPLNKIYHKYISRKEPYSLEGVEKLLKKFKKNVILYKGNSNEILKDFEHKNIDYVIIDGGHSYDTVKQDLKLSAKILSKEGIIMCDDYMHNEAPGVKNAVDDFVSNSDFKIEIINKRMAKLYR